MMLVLRPSISTSLIQCALSTRISTKLSGLKNAEWQVTTIRPSNQSSFRLYACTRLGTLSAGIGSSGITSSPAPARLPSFRHRSTASRSRTSPLAVLIYHSPRFTGSRAVDAQNIRPPEKLFDVSRSFDIETPIDAIWKIRIVEQDLETERFCSEYRSSSDAS